MSTVSSRHSPASSALPASEKASGPGSISRKDRQHRRPPAHARAPPSPPSAGAGRRSIGVEQTRRRLDDQPAGVEVDDRNDRAGKRDHRRRAAGALDFERVAGAEIMDRAHPPERRPVAQHRFEPDQIGVVIFLRPRWRQRRARADRDASPATPRRGCGPRPPTGARSGRPWRRRSGAAPSADRRSRRRAAHRRRRLRVGGKALDPHRAADPVRAGDDPDADLLCRCR